MKITKVWPIQDINRDKRKKETDATYLAWLRTQASAYSGVNRHIVAAHYRTAANSGMGCKPLFSAIPLTQTEHAQQHQIGQFVFASKLWWEAMVKRYQQKFLMSGGVIPDKFLIK